MRPHILVIDDARAVRLLVQKALNSFICDVSEANNGFTALFAMEKKLPDLLLLDVSMPTMGGLELLTMMRGNPQLSALPVIMLISPADHKVLPELTTLGVSAMVKKPFGEANLADAVRSVIKLKPARPAA